MTSFKVIGVIRFLSGVAPTRLSIRDVMHVEILYDVDAARHGWPMTACRTVLGGRNHRPEERELVAGPPTCLWCMVARWPWDSRDDGARPGRWR